MINAPDITEAADVQQLAGLVYVEPDTCPLPALVIRDDEGTVTVLESGQVYVCPHYTWTSVWVQIRGGMAQPSWIRRPPLEPPPEPPPAAPVIDPTPASDF